MNIMQLADAYAEAQSATDQSPIDAHDIKELCQIQRDARAALAEAVERKDAALRLALEVMPYLEALNSDVEKQRSTAIAAIKEVL
jgi:hypothetical protein